MARWPNSKEVIHAHLFYAAKCGFTRVESDPIVGSPEDEYVYRKDMLTPPAAGVDPRLAAQGED